MGNWYLLNMQQRKWRKLNNSWCIGLSWLCLTAAQFHFLFDILSSHPTYLPHFNHFLRPPPHPPRFWTFGRYQWKLPKIVTAWGRFRTMILTGRFSPRSKHPELSRIAPCTYCTSLRESHECKGKSFFCTCMEHMIALLQRRDQNERL